MMINEKFNYGKLEYLRVQAKERFTNTVKGTWIDAGSWALPHRTRWMLNQIPGERNNKHIVDPQHILALRSYVAGFLEGNTSATRPWFRIIHADPGINSSMKNREWLDLFTRRVLDTLSSSNFYNAAGQFYYDFGVFNTGTHFMEELPNGTIHFHTLIPGSYYCINNHLGVADTLVREFSMTVQALIDCYGQTDKHGNYNWDNFSAAVKNLYDQGNYTQKIDVVQIIQKNKEFDHNQPVGGSNRQWVSVHYEIGTAKAGTYTLGFPYEPEPRDKNKYLRISYSKRKPFIVGRSDSSDNFEYGEKGPTTDALGLIKSLNKKAITKDVALEKMAAPTIQGPANLKKSYITTQANKFIPLDATSMSQGGLKHVYEINPAIATLSADVEDLRRMVDKIYYADFLLYLSMNPKTRTATETQAIVNEQQLVIGPNLQSLNWTYNVPVVEFAMDYVLDNDPYLPPPPPDLQGQFLRTEFVSVFAQAQRAADLPSIDRYVDRMMAVAQLNPSVWDKVNLDRLADLYEDRLFLPAGLNRDQKDVDSHRQQAQAEVQKQQMIQQSIPALAGAAKDLGIQQQTQQGVQQ